MRKTSVYVPDGLKRRLAELARRSHRSEAELIRTAIEQLVEREAPDPGAAGPAHSAAPGPETAPVTAPDPAQPGRLVGVGIGPGDPGLLTVRALRALRRADRVYAPSTAIDAVGRAEAIVRAAAPDVVCERLVFVMAPHPHDRAAALAQAAVEVAARLDEGEEVAFITLGDPNVYSTFAALVDAVRLHRPGLAVAVEPGITAFQELAARSGTVLVDERQTLTLLTGLDGAAQFDAELADPERAVVLYKGGRRLPDMVAALHRHGRADDAVMGELLGQLGERIGPVAALGELPAGYLATVIVPPARPSAPPEPAR